MNYKEEVKRQIEIAERASGFALDVLTINSEVGISILAVMLQNVVENNCDMPILGINNKIK